MQKIINQYYHIYNRGAHKELIFLDKSDYWRFIYLLYISNNDAKLRFYNIKLHQIFSSERKCLVDIIAYCLMPNHFHILIKETTHNGISKFMHKLCTSYSMYYNFKYDHSGTIIQGTYKSKYIDSDEYFRRVIQYIHLNPFGIENPDMLRTAKSEYFEEAIAYSCKYEFSSFKDFLGENRIQSVILSKDQPYYKFPII